MFKKVMFSQKSIYLGFPRTLTSESVVDSLYPTCLKILVKKFEDVFQDPKRITSSKGH